MNYEELEISWIQFQNGDKTGDNTNNNGNQDGQDGNDVTMEDICLDFGVDAEILEGLDLEDMDLYKVEADAPLTEDEKAAVWDELACLIATAEKLRENIKGTQLMHSLFQFGSGGDK